jgi:hypothetical protein
MSQETTTTLPRPPTKLYYSLTGENSSRAVERGLAEAEWYQSYVPRATMRKLLERRDGPAIRDTTIWSAYNRLRLRYVFAMAIVAGRDSIFDLCGPLCLHFRFALARI